MRNLFFLLGMLICSFSQGQDIPVTLKSSSELQADTFVGVDEYKNLYYIKDNIFYKAEGGKIFQYNDFLLGDLSSADILNPLKIVLFYQDTNTAVLLDNTLSEIMRVNFNSIQEFRNVQYATTSIDRNLWIFNLDLQQLEVFDYNRNELVANSFPISEEVLGQKSNYNFCWLQTESSLLKFNIYGSLMNEYSVEGLIGFAEKNGNLIVKDAEAYKYLKKGDASFKHIALPKLDVKQLYLDIENLYIYDGKLLHYYQLQLPKN